MAEFGYHVIGGTTWRIPQTFDAVLCWFTLPENGTITSVSVYNKADTDGNGNRKPCAGIYSAARALLGTSDSTFIDFYTAVPSWKTYALTVPLVVTAGTYGIAFMTQLRDWTLYQDAGAVNQNEEDTAGVYPLQDPFTPDIFQDWNDSLYATYTPNPAVIMRDLKGVGL